MPPVWNARTAGMLSQLVARVGAEDAPHVAAYYVRHRRAAYVERMHPVGMLLQDCESLRAQWASQRQITGIEARDVERRGATLSAYDEVMRRRKAGEGVGDG